MVQDLIATSRIEIEATRLLVLAAAAELDLAGAAAARTRIAMAKVAAAQLQQRVLDRAVQVHGALGLSDDTPLAAMWRFGRALRVLDGPDEVHKRSIARAELRRRLDPDLKKPENTEKVV